MMTEARIRMVIIETCQAMEGSCNERYLDHRDGVLRGLIWALTGDDPGPSLGEDSLKVLTLAGIPCRKAGGKVHFDVPSEAAA